jgi:hypothetical protein
MSLALTACGTKDKPRTLACVGEVSISSTQLTHWQGIIAGLGPSAKHTLLPADDLTARSALQAKAFLIASSRVIAEANELDVEIPEGKVANTLRLDEFKEAHGSVIESSRYLRQIQAIKRRGALRRDRLWLTRVRLLEAAVQARELAQAERALPHTRILAYYLRHKRRFWIPERRDVAVFQNFKKQKAELARREIEAGRNVLSVLELRNEEPVAGGFKRNMTKSRLIHPYELDYFAAKPHTLVGPREYEIYYMFEVMAIKPSRQRSFAEVEQEIRHTLISGPAHRVLVSIAQAAEKRLPSRASCRQS